MFRCAPNLTPSGSPAAGILILVSLSLLCMESVCVCGESRHESLDSIPGTRRKNKKQKIRSPVLV
jgi:hypothetical protein